ncbi:MAG: hypothetical protein WCK89_22415 [bacterium]
MLRPCERAWVIVIGEHVFEPATPYTHLRPKDKAEPLAPNPHFLSPDLLEQFAVLYTAIASMVVFYFNGIHLPGFEPQ